jgi:hypothetical protein
MFAELFPSSGCCTVAYLHSCYLAVGLHVTVCGACLASPPEQLNGFCLYQEFIHHWSVLGESEHPSSKSVGPRS